MRDREHQAKVRPAAHAGTFYSGEPGRLRAEIAALMAPVAASLGPSSNEPLLKAFIVPHAGYIYSGPIAASAYARLALRRTEIRRVVLVGPSHFASFRGVATSGVDWFASPLGLVPVDVAGVSQACALPGVRVWDGPHEPEHCLEVQIPFLQSVLDEFSIVPLLASETGTNEIGALLEALWGGPETCLIVSSDLSHYHDSATARDQDAATARHIEMLNPDALSPDDACGRIPICGLLEAASRRGLRGLTVDLRNSGDTAGSTQRVVGYGAFVFH